MYRAKQNARTIAAFAGLHGRTVRDCGQDSVTPGDHTEALTLVARNLDTSFIAKG
jgi:hypothetical protein